MTTWTIIPVKQLDQSKRRLEHLLSAVERANLIAGFLDQLLDVLTSVTAVDHVLVVTGDEQAAEITLRHGVEVLAESEPYDLNSAVAQGRDYALSQGAMAVLVLPVDVPLVQAEDIQAMLRPLKSVSGPLAAICSDGAGDGTNALLLSPPNDFEFHYGPGSFGRHIAEAAQRDRETVLIYAPGLRFDLDNEGDWRVFSRLPLTADNPS